MVRSRWTRLLPLTRASAFQKRRRLGDLIEVLQKRMSLSVCEGRLVIVNQLHALGDLCMILWLSRSVVRRNPRACRRSITRPDPTTETSTLQI